MEWEKRRINMNRDKNYGKSGGGYDAEGILRLDELTEDIRAKAYQKKKQ